MRSDQRAKLERYKRELEAARADKLHKAMELAVTRLSDAVEAVANAEKQEIPAPVITNVIDMSELKDLVSKVHQPVVKVDMPRQEAPVVNVTMPDTDIYARYKRYNSQIDPEGTYHAFLDNEGNWFIQLESTMNSGRTDITRYAVGNGEIPKAWAGRKRLTYKPLDRVVIP